jgi:hypothetical protein
VGHIFKLEPFVQVNPISSANTTAPTAPVFEFVVLTPPTPFRSKHLYFSHEQPLFAVVCGINDYESRDFSRLRGAVADAAEVMDLLVTNYQVPRDQIRFLTNKGASRSGIISALDGLSTDPLIRRGDPILFYFAGHGSEIPPPEGWECGGPGSKIQVLVPHDYCSDAGHEIPGIPDRTIGFLLDKIAHRKGDNIVCYFLLNG